MTVGNGNGSRLGPFRKVDIVFALGVGLIVYGAVTFHVELVVAGIGICGVPLAQRADKG